MRGWFLCAVCWLARQSEVGSSPQSPEYDPRARGGHRVHSFLCDFLRVSASPRCKEKLDSFADFTARTLTRKGRLAAGVADGVPHQILLKPQIRAIARQHQERLTPLLRIFQIPRAAARFVLQPEPPFAAENQLAAAFARIVNQACHRRARLAAGIQTGDAAPGFCAVALAKNLDYRYRHSARLKHQPRHRFAVGVLFNLDEYRGNRLTSPGKPSEKSLSGSCRGHPFCHPPTE